MYPKAAVDVSMLVPFISHAQIPNPVKCKILLQSPAFSRFQPKNHPLDSTKTQIKRALGAGGVLASSARAFDSPSPWAGHGVWRQRSPIIVLWFCAAVARTNWPGLETNFSPERCKSLDW